MVINMKKRILAALLAAMMAISVTACGSGGESSSSESSGNEKSESSSESSSVEASSGTATEVVWDAYTPYDETVTFTKCRAKPTYDQNFAEGDDITNNPYTRYVLDEVNVNTELAWETDPNTYDQKVSLSIASGDIPDMMLVNRQIFKQLVQNNLIQDMGEAYEKCISPFLKPQFDSYGSAPFDACTVDGKLMGIPEPRLYGSNVGVVWVRTDYLEKVGMEMPKTMADVAAVAKAFKEQDVSGTGKTIGLTISEKVATAAGGNYDMLSAFNAVGAYPGYWVEGEGGKAVYGSTLPEMKTTLKTLSEMYAEGTLDKEFAVRKQTDRSALVASGQTGLLFSGWWPEGSMGDCVINNQEADWAPIVLRGENGKIEVAQDDPISQILVVRNGYEHPEAIVKVLNTTYDALRGNGQGKRCFDDITKNYPTMDWSVCCIPMAIDYYDSIGKLADDLDQALAKGDKNAMEMPQYGLTYDLIMDERANPKTDAATYMNTMARTVGSMAIQPSHFDYISVKPMAYFGKTETMVSKWANLEKLEQEMMVQIITGERPLDYFEEFVTQWYAMGGQTITDEVNAEK